MNTFGGGWQNNRRTLTICEDQAANKELLFFFYAAFRAPVKLSCGFLDSVCLDLWAPFKRGKPRLMRDEQGKIFSSMMFRSAGWDREAGAVCEFLLSESFLFSREEQMKNIFRSILQCVLRQRVGPSKLLQWNKVPGTIYHLLFFFFSAIDEQQCFCLVPGRMMKRPSIDTTRHAPNVFIWIDSGRVWSRTCHSEWQKLDVSTIHPPELHQLSFKNL